MAFWGDEFIFDGISCHEHGLMIYHFGSEESGDASFKPGTVVEDRLPSRYDTLHYGVVQNEPLEFNLVFGANIDSIDAVSPPDRYDVEAIASWLIGHSKYKWLMICQPDMETFRYKCRISELKLITYGDVPWAFSCKVSCDSPFAYEMPREYNYSVNGEKQITLFNRSSYNGYYKPKLEIVINGGESFSIENLSDSGRKLEFKDLPATRPIIISIDNKNEIITCENDFNLYKSFNMKFLRLKRGDNVLKFSGVAEIKFICEYPVNIGG